ncbi:putative ribonuclease P/MRP protein subunit POP5 [Apostichopus japonicus]|uniref:Ribonuclease P/MRP protein subunit POP5 n=1 Tax=Stichopus japonicus TaxID=307972 RepID=A0A2G8LHS9_STIJA|nr:putative ribonuclease P/MRP protein subunit POP5 [Apostichopus japonicus]
MVRLKNRYFLCKVIFPSPDESNEMLTSQEFRRAIEKAARKSLGSSDLALWATGYEMHINSGSSIFDSYLLVGKVIKVNSHSKTAIVRVQHRATRMLSQLLPFIKQHQKTDVIIQTLHVTGTVATCQKALIKYERRTLLELLRNTTNKDHRKKIQEALLSCTLDLQGQKIASDNDNDGFT